MRIVFFETEEWEEGVLRDALVGHDCRFVTEPLDTDTAAQASGADIVSVFVYSKVTREVLGMLPSVKLVTTRSMGYDHIDLAACGERRVAVSRVPSYGEVTVAEHAFGLILGLSRRIYAAYERTERHEFDYRGLQGIDLFGKTIGIIGGGRIGMHVARIAHGFGMEVVVADPKPSDALAKEHGFRYATLDDLYAEADVLTLHAPLLPQTTHMLDDAAFAKMRKGVLLVNTARGALIDTAALLRALESGIVAGAGLDVLEGECELREESELMRTTYPEKCDLGALMRNHALIKRDDVIITPHIGFNSREAMERILLTTVENIDGFAAGTPLNIVG